MKKSEGYGRVLRHLREERALRQEDLARRIGVSPSQVPKWEREHQGIRLESLMMVLDALEVPLERFGGLFDRLRRGEPLEADEGAGEAEGAGTPDHELEPAARRALIVLWEDGVESRTRSDLPPGVQAELDIAMREVGRALDHLRPPEDDELDEDRGQTGTNGDPGEG